MGYFNGVFTYGKKPIIRLFTAALQLQDVSEYEDLLQVINGELATLFTDVPEENGRKYYRGQGYVIIYHANGLCESDGHNIVLPAWETNYFKNAHRAELRARKKREQEVIVEPEQQGKRKQRTKPCDPVHYRVLCDDWGNVWYAQLKMYMKKGYQAPADQIIPMEDVKNHLRAMNMVSDEEAELLKMNPRFIDNLQKASTAICRFFGISEHNMRYADTNIIVFLNDDELAKLVETFELCRGKDFDETRWEINKTISEFNLTDDSVRPRIILPKGSFEAVNIGKVNPKRPWNRLSTAYVFTANGIKTLNKELAKIVQDNPVKVLQKHKILAQ